MWTASCSLEQLQERSGLNTFLCPLRLSCCGLTERGAVSVLCQRVDSQMHASRFLCRAISSLEQNLKSWGLFRTRV